MADNIKNPSHYNREGAMECLEEMILVFGIDFVMDWCKGNVWKYRYRAGQKGNAAEDIAKSDQYMKFVEELKHRKAIEACEGVY